MFKTIFRRFVEKCYMRSRLPALGPSSCTAQEDLTPKTLPSKRRPASTRRGTNKTESDEARLHELTCYLALWLDTNNAPTIPPAAIRATLETAARKTKEGPMVREVVVAEVMGFSYDKERYGTELLRIATAHNAV